MNQSESERRCIAVDAHVELDGRSAKVSGIQNQFATVATTDSRRESSYEFAWATVHRVIAQKAGRFYS